MIKKIKITLILLVIFQILLLINLPFSHSYFINEKEKLNENNINENVQFDLIKKGLNFLIGFLSIKEIGVVSAEGFWCCEKINDSTCQPINPGEECDEQIWQTKCDSTSLCQTGTCVDREEGTCSVGTKKECGEENWQAKTIDKVEECNFGCCTLNAGTSKKFIRKVACQNENGEFNPSVKESECKVYTQEMGACLQNENCKFTTEKDCKTNLRGDFRAGILCSSPDLNTKCDIPDPQEIKTKCYNDKVYFLDTCDNIANVYNPLKITDEDYWTFVQEPECELEFNNKGFLEESSQKICGNCDLENSKCDSAFEEEINPDYGDYVCKDLKCVDESGKVWQNQESWCVYESYVGDGKDVVGSEHRIRWCDEGTIKTDLCGNWRGKICGETEIITQDGTPFSMARCRFNEGVKCLQEQIEYEFNEDGEIINEDEIKKSEEKCNSLSDCKTETIDFYDPDKKDYVKFGVCVPEYPIGLEFWELEGKDNTICDVASVEIPTTWKKGVLTDWECEINCEVLTQEFANQMNDFCISLGDCGGYVNVEGEYSKNFKSFNPKSLGSKYETEKYNSNGDIDSDKKSEYKSYATKGEKNSGDLPDYLSSSELAHYGGENPLDAFMGMEIDLLSLFENWMAIGFGVGTLAIGTIATYSIASTLLETVTFAAVQPWLIAVVVVAAVITFLFGKWETKEVIIKFECQPWQAPTGGDNCEECNNDPLRPCTEYKCRSLGAGCRLIDENELYESENPVCIYKYDNDVIPPQIKFNKINQEKYTIDENTNNRLKIRMKDGEAIREASYLNFSLRTEDENGIEDYSKCVYNLRPTSLNAPDYELEGEEFKERNSFSVIHSFNERLPYVADLDSADITGNVKGEREGELNLYVRCLDYSGNPNVAEYVVNILLEEGADITPASVSGYTPENESFLKFGEINKSVIIYLDEPAECRWSLEPDKLYEDMVNEFDYCDLNTEGKCETEIEGLTELENKIYIKCKDQPWISNPDYDGPWGEENRNVNTNDVIYTIYKTENNLQISSISPSGTVVRGGDVAEIDLEVTSSGGMENGISRCKYQFLESPTNTLSGDWFSQEDSSHSYPLNLPSGDYNILITCEDKTGNNVEENAIFTLQRDDVAPIIVRAYKEGSNLKIITDELSKCAYSFEDCDFGFDDEDAIDITSTFSIEHTTKWKPSVTYNIKCKDLFENVNPDCAIKIIPSS